jgi:hypothetical protein
MTANQASVLVRPDDGKAEVKAQGGRRCCPCWGQQCCGSEWFVDWLPGTHFKQTAVCLQLNLAYFYVNSRIATTPNQEYGLGMGRSVNKGRAGTWTKDGQEYGQSMGLIWTRMDKNMD